MIRIESPNIIFLACNSLYQRRITNALLSKLPVAIERPFAQPIYDAVTGMFFLYAPGINVAEPPTQLPYPPHDPAPLFPKLEEMMKEHFGYDLLGEMMCEHIRMETAYCETLIIPDSIRRWDEILYVADRVGNDRCKHVHVDHLARATRGTTRGIYDICYPIGAAPTDAEFEHHMTTLALELAPPQSPQPAVAPQQLRVVQ